MKLSTYNKARITMKKILYAIVILAACTFLLVLSRGVQERGDEQALVLSGNVEVTEVSVGFKIPGRVEKVFFSEGERVSKGQTLALLEASELRHALEQSKVGLEEAEIRVAQLKKGARPQEIEQARANVLAIQAELERLKKDHDRALRLLREGAVSASYFDSIRSAYEAKQALLKSAKEQLNLIEEGPREEEIRIAEKRVEQARLSVKMAEERLENACLRSPITGVIFRKNVEEGEVVTAFTPVFTIGDLERPWIKVYVPEEKLGLLRLGQRALVSVDTFKGKFYEGRVSYISEEAEFTPKTVQTKEERVKLVYAVKVSVKNQNGELKPGMPADVKIILNE